MLRKFAVALLPLALAGCFMTPGKFGATLDLRRNGDFAFAYKGEIIFQSPDDFMKPGGEEAWSDDQARCSAEDSGDSRPCTPAEIAKQRKDWEADAAARREKNQKEAAQFGAMFGYTPGDEAANQRLAATIARYEGWKSVVYRGKGVFDVDYQTSGKLTQDFVFPLIPGSDIVFPFVAVRRQTDGSVRVNAPSLVGGAFQGMAARMKAMGESGEPGLAAASHAEGRFTIVTDGEVLTNNTDGGATAGVSGKALIWDIAPGSQKIPEALIRLR